MADTADGRVPAAGSLGHVLLCSMRDEGPYLLEYVAHHRAIGFDHLFIASNDCVDGTDLLLDALDAVGAIKHYRNDVRPDELAQHKAYAQMRELHGLDRADWLMVLDADEFLTVDIGDHTVKALTSAVPEDVDIIMLNARSFGTTDDPHWRPGLVTEQFKNRMPLRHSANGSVKSITRGIGRFKVIQNHCVGHYSGDEPLTVIRADQSVFTIEPGEALWKKLRWVKPEQIRHGMASYNHYSIKSAASFCLRQAKPLGAAPLTRPNDRHTLGYFDVRAAAADKFDGSFSARYGERLRAEYDRLLSLPGIAAAQAETERLYGGMISRLMDQDDD